MSKSRHGRTRRPGYGLFVFLGSAVAFVLLALGVSNSLAGFSASIDNSTNTAGAGTVVMEEDQGATTCLSSTGATITTANAGTCAAINKFGGNLAMTPGQTVSAALTIKNDGSVTPASFTLTPSACTQSNNGAQNGTATDFCAKLLVTIKSGTTTVFSGTAASLAAGGAITVPVALIPAPAASTPFTFTIQLDPAATNAYQGLAASEPLLWAFGS